MADLLISRIAPGVARVRSTDPFDSLEIYRIERSAWEATPELPGIYLLHGQNPVGKLTVYVGMSTTNMRGRVRSHHVNPAKNWFGVLFAVPLPSALLCAAVEAELIGELNEAGAVDVVANVAEERRMRDATDVHVEPAVEKIRDALQLMLGSDIFVAADAGEELGAIDAPVERMAPLAREYKGGAADVAQRAGSDPADATHRWVGASVIAWGRFEGDEPDKRFLVLATSQWRRSTPNPEAATYDTQLRLSETQDGLVKAGVLDEAEGRFTVDHVFPNWSAAARVVGGKGTFSGAYHWQRIS